MKLKLKLTLFNKTLISFKKVSAQGTVYI